MAVPTIISVTPASGPTGGWTLVTILGTNFRLPPAPPPTGPVPKGPNTARVTFGGVQAQDVKVFTAGFLVALTPVHDVGAADIVVQNLDDSGNPIAGEAVTRVGGFNFQRPALTVESLLTRITRALIRELKRQVFATVADATDTDYDSTTGDGLNLIEVPSVPCMLLGGPQVVEDREKSDGEEPEDELTVQGVPGYNRRRVPKTVRLSFTVGGVSNSLVELLNLLAATTECFHRTKYLSLDREPDNPAAGAVRYPLQVPFEQAFQVTRRPNKDNVGTFSGVVVVEGVDLVGHAGVTDDAVFDKGAETGEDGATISGEPLSS